MRMTAGAEALLLVKRNPTKKHLYNLRFGTEYQAMVLIAFPPLVGDTTHDTSASALKRQEISQFLGKQLEQ